MSQIFHPSLNLIAKAMVLGIVILTVVGSVVSYVFVRSPYMRGTTIAREQPVFFSHEHHVGELGLDCRYCHVNVERSSFAGVPSTDICMGCHSQVWANSPAIAPIKESMETDTPIFWNRVNNVPDYAFFNHSIHINKGIPCKECHGRVDKMGWTRKDQPLSMEWCLNCHRHRQDHLVPREEVFNMQYELPKDPAEREALQAALVEKYHVDIHQFNVTDCSVCHR